MLRLRSRIAVIALILAGMCASLLFSGCGGADVGDYEHDVAELNETSAKALEEAYHFLSEGEHDSEEGRIEMVVAALEEAVTALGDILEELEGVRVPGGMEDFHRSLIETFHAQLTFCEGLTASLGYGGGHAGGASHGGEGHDEDHGEAPHEEEEPAGGSGH